MPSLRPHLFAPVLTLLVAGCTRPPELGTVGDPAPPLRLAVATLHPAGDPLSESPEGIALSQLLHLALGLADDLELYAPDRTVLLELEGVLAAPGDPATRHRVGGLIAVDALLAGWWSRQPDGRLLAEVELHETHSRALLAAARSSAEEDDLVALASGLVGTLRRALELPPIDTAGRLGPLVPARLATLAAFSEGRRRLWLSDPAVAAERLGEAVAADPRAALSHAGLARSLFALGRVSRAAASAERALELGGGLGVPHGLELAILVDRIEGRAPAMVRQARRLAAARPLDREARWGLARALLFAGDGDGCREVLEELRHQGLGSAGELQAVLLAAEVARADRDGERQRRLALEGEERATRLGLELPKARAKLLLAEALLAHGETTGAEHGETTGAEHGETTGAGAAAAEAREIFLAFSHRRQAAAALAYRARALHQQGEPARGAYRQALDELRRERDPRAVAALLNNLAVLEQGEGNLDRAVQLHLESLEMKRALRDHAGAGRTLVRLAAVELRRGEPPRAVERYWQALDHWRRAGRPLDEIETGLLLAGSLAGTGAAPGAVAALERAVELAERAGSPLLEARGRAALGEALLQQGELEAAGRQQETALRLFATAEHRAGVARARLALASIALEQRRLGEARVMAGAALDLLITLQDRPSEALCRAVLAWTLLEMGELASAGDHMARALALAAAVDDPRLRLFLATADARLRWAAGDRQPARRRLETIAEEAAGGGLTAARLEAELVLAEIDLAEGSTGEGRRRLARVEAEAREAGLVLIAMRAANL